MNRQLAAILYADVAGYSRLTGRDEDETHRKLNAGLNLLTDLISDQGGQKLHEAGDAILAEFQSVTAAVECAVEFQRRMSAQNEDLADENRLEFRIGVNLGEVIHDRDDIYGEGVNLAARIQEQADPGGVCISGAVHEQIAGKTDQVFDDLGYRKLKNIARAVRVYQARFSEFQSSGEDRLSWPYITTARRKPKATGGCLCRGVRFEAWDEPIAVGYCHCRFCQLALGAPLSAWIIYRKNAVRFLGDELKLYRSSLIAERGFCGSCGTSLFTDHHAPDESEYLSIRLATMDNPADFPPTLHFGVESQLPWLDINDDLPRIRTDDDPEMQRRWAAVGRPDPADQLPTSPRNVSENSDIKARSE